MSAADALLLLAVWMLGALWGGYRYERLWKDRSIREIVSDLRGSESR